MNMKWFALLGLVLFFGVTIAPSVNAGVVKDTIKKRVDEKKDNLIQSINNVKSNTKEPFKIKSIESSILLIILTAIEEIFGDLAIILNIIGFLIPALIFIVFYPDFGYILFLFILAPIWVPIYVISTFFGYIFNGISRIASRLLEIIESWEPRNRNYYTTQQGIIISKLSQKVEATI